MAKINLIRSQFEVASDDGRYKIFVEIDRHGKHTLSVGARRLSYGEQQPDEFVFCNSKPETIAAVAALMVEASKIVPFKDYFMLDFLIKPSGEKEQVLKIEKEGQ